MRRSIFALTAILAGGSVVTLAQTVQPNRIAAGGEVTVALDCPAGKPILLLDKKELPATEQSVNPKWVFKIDSTVAAKKYSAIFRCPAAAKPTDSAAGDLEVSAATTTTPPVPAPEPSVVKVVNITRESKTPQPATQPQPGGEPAELKDVLQLEVSDLDAWLAKDAKNTMASLRLFLAGVELKNVVPTRSSKVPAVLQVSLEPESDVTAADRDGVVRKAWVQVIQTSYRGRDIDISVGPTGQAPFGTKQKLTLQVYPDYTWAVVAFLLMVLVAVVLLGKFTNMLRDNNGVANPPYSLAKHQMAVWFVVVIGAYLYIWLITGFFMSISTTALTLIGISGATGLVAVTMDASKRSEAAKARVVLKAEHDALEKILNDPASGIVAQLRAAAPGSVDATELTANVTPKLAKLLELKAQIAAAAPVASPNQVWYKDLLSDENGISFHRLQMAIWTLVLVVVFARAVYTDILMPDFDATLLGLIGISSGTYLGFKFPEKPA